VQLALLADVHGNVEALDAVLRDVQRRAPRAALVCAGDVVGYGPDPEACIERLRARGAAFALGNHEEMVLGRRPLAGCVRAGILAAVWTREHLSAAARRFLLDLPAWCAPAPGVVACHGDLSAADRYVSTAPRASAALEQLRSLRQEARVLVCGHTHQPMLFGERRGLATIGGEDPIALPTNERCLINPGAVGQARNGGPIARYALLDLDAGVVSFCGVAYDHARTVQKLRRLRLVPRVVLTPPRGVLARRIEGLRWRLAHSWAQRRLRDLERPDG
jgi:diadenosine tetraphosphatase ApaH/serine/threonine PP2A family protein phosphatase